MLANTPVLARRLALTTPGLVLHMRSVLLRGGSSIRWTRTPLSSFFSFFLPAHGVFKVVDGAIIIEDAAKGSFGEWMLFPVGMSGHRDLNWINEFPFLFEKIVADIWGKTGPSALFSR